MIDDSEIAAKRPSVHKIEQNVSADLKAHPHHLDAVYKELHQDTECDTFKTRQHILADVNDHLHAHGLIPHLELTQDLKTETGFSDKKLTDPRQTTAPILSAERIPMIKSALELDHVSPTKQNINALRTVIYGESTWRPIDPDTWDINAQEGHPSQGLMQEIPSTFKEFALPGYNKHINDPLSNLTSGIRNIIDTYGSLNKAPGVVSRKQGGPYIGYN